MLSRAKAFKTMHYQPVRQHSTKTKQWCLATSVPSYHGLEACSQPSDRIAYDIYKSENLILRAKLKKTSVIIRCHSTGRK